MPTKQKPGPGPLQPLVTNKLCRLPQPWARQCCQCSQSPLKQNQRSSSVPELQTLSPCNRFMPALLTLQHLSVKVENLFPATSLSLLLKKHFLILKLLFIYAKESWSHWAVEILGACNNVLMTATCESAYTCLILITWTAWLKSMRPYSRHNLSAFVISGTAITSGAWTLI